MIGDEDGVTIATFRKVSPLEYVRGPKKERSPEEEAEEAVKRIIKENRTVRERKRERQSK